MAKLNQGELRVCASCEWIFHKRNADEHGSCPVCHFAHYGARYVYGNKCYKFYKTQEPFKRKKLDNFSILIYWEIKKYQTCVKLNKPISASKDKLVFINNSYITSLVKNCPFCNASPELGSKTLEDGKKEFFIYCECGCRLSKIGTDHSEVLKLWNSRPWVHEK